MTRSTKPITPTHPHFTLPAILPAMITGLFILTACGGSALTNDAPIATNTQNDTCADNPLADGCQADAGFLSVNLDEDNANQEAESSEAPPAPKPVVAKTPPAPITQEDTSDSTPQTAYSTYSSPAGQPVGSAETSPKSEPAVSGQQSEPTPPATITAATTTAFTDLPTMRNTTTQTNEFLKASTWMPVERLAAIGYTSHLGVRTRITIPEEDRLLPSTTRHDLNRLGAVRADPLRMNLGQATYDGVAIGRDVADGIDFFTADFQVSTKNSDQTIATISLSRYHYAGILSGTDLGAPVASEVGMATWNGSFRTYNTNPVDFQLTVTFGGIGARTISAFVKDNAWSAVDNYYLVDGTYTNAGLITGTVNWGTFSTLASDSVDAVATDGETAGTPRAKNGTLTGLIGVQGAVAVFISDTNDEATSGGYVGGFVAAPSDIAIGSTDVRFKDWARAIPTVTGGNNGFLAGGAYGLFQAEAIALTQGGSLNLAGAGFEEVTQSGVAFVTDGISRTTLTSGKSFAGLLSGTDLGAPISDANQVGEWKGQFKSVGGYYFGGASRADQYINTAVDTDFTLTVTFGDVSGKAGSIEAFVSTSGIDRRFLLAGTYDDKGVITGTVLAGLFNNDDKSNPSATINGVLTGLIGIEGAVGAFVSNKDNYNYAGGFVVSPITPDTEREVTFGDWTRSFATEPALAPTTGTPQSEFLQTTGSTLATGDLTARAGGAITVTTLDLNTATLRNNPLGGDDRDGVAFYQGYINSDGAGYAGIFSTTDLGRPITAKDARAEWRGQFQVIESRKINTDFTLEVTFGAVAGVDGSVGKVEAFIVQVAPNLAHHYVRGTFNSAGVITGTATAGFFPNGRHSLSSSGGVHDGILTGLIGEDGAVGAFYSNTGVYAGGFVALPLAHVTAGTTAFWERNARTATANVYPTILPDGTATLTKTGSESNDDDQANFMRAGAAALDLGADALADVTIPTAYNVNLDQLVDSTDATSGFALVHAHSTADATRLNLYVGLLAGTDVGAPFTDLNIPAAVWTGILRLESPQAQISFKKSVDFAVTFNGGVGRIITNTIELGAGRQATNSLTIAGQFGANGLIYGTTTANLGTGSADVTGTLSGLIGVKGAVAVFTGDDTATNGSYVGGFVALPLAPVTTGSAAFWTRNAREVTPGESPDILPYGTATLTKTGSEPNDDSEANFIRAGATALDLGADARDGVTIATAYNANLGELLDGTDATSGFALAHAHSTADATRFNLYVGLLSGTDVGAPFTDLNRPIADWTGILRLESPQAQISFNKSVDFTVAFDGTDGTITTSAIELGAGRQATNSLTIAGQFGANGLIYGTTTANLGTGSAEVTGTLSGLIGVEGAVAVFAGNDTATNGSYAGGFVARPRVYATYDAWLDSFGGPLRSAAANINLAPVNQFLQSGPDAINAGNVANATILTLKMAGDAEKMKNGVSFLQGEHSWNFRTVFFAGVLSGTNLGVPLAVEAGKTATWNGEIQWVGSLDNNTNGQADKAGREAIAGSGEPARAFMLDVNFGTSKIEAFVPMGDNSHHLLLTAGYNGSGQFTNGRVEYGVFAGGVKEGARTASGANDVVFGGRLTGIIGQEGAVGVFISDAVTGGVRDYGFAGGFWAAPE